MLLHLIRHGHYPLVNNALGGRDPYPLSAQGVAEAEALAEVLAERPIVAIVSSPVRRALDTAEPIARRLAMPVETDAAFNEIAFAQWTGKRFAELSEDPAWRAWNTFRGTAGVPGGETILAVQNRAVAGMMELRERYAGREVAVVTHADVIKVLVGHVLGAPLDLMHRMEITPASVSRIEVQAAAAKVLAMNWTAPG